MLDGFIVIDSGLVVLVVMLDESSDEVAADIPVGITSIATAIIANIQVHMAIIDHIGSEFLLKA